MLPAPPQTVNRQVSDKLVNIMSHLAANRATNFPQEANVFFSYFGQVDVNTALTKVWWCPWSTSYQLEVEMVNVVLMTCFHRKQKQASMPYVFIYFNESILELLLLLNRGKSTQQIGRWYDIYRKRAWLHSCSLFTSFIFHVLWLM